MNKDLLSTLVNQLWKIVAGPLILLFIPLYLTPIEQGYWYTFTAIAALAIFADLGFSTIILQFAAHEFAFLQFGASRILCGDEKHLWRLASFFRFSVRWLFRIILIVFPLILVGGFCFLSMKQDAVDWQYAWVVYACASAVVFFNTSLICFFEGCNSVSLLQSVRFRIGVLQSGTLLLGLFFGLDLYALSASLLSAAISGIILLLYYFRRTILQLWCLSSERCYDWWPEFSSLIWRYAISWGSGYFIFQLFTPLAFYFHGAEFSGKIGLSIALWTAGNNIASSWITAITPRINILISERKWAELDKLFHKNITYACLTMLVGGALYFVLYYELHDKVIFFSRILEPTAMFMLYLSWSVQTWISAVAVYLRAHKKEPLMFISFLSAIYISVTTLLCAMFLSLEYLFLGFLSSCLGSAVVVYRIWIRQKKEHLNMV